MGDHLQTLVAAGMAEEEAAARGPALLRWLIGERVLAPEPQEQGYVAGPAWERVTRERPAEPCDGVEILTGRQMFFGWSGGEDDPLCPSCFRAVADGEWPGGGGCQKALTPVLESWYAGGSGAVRCPLCGTATPLTAWRWQDDLWVFAHLGLTFLNAPPLSAEFVAEVAAVLEHDKVRWLATEH
ncbi:hypothetical protein [Streptomyces sp. SID11385]|uniref:hypothetical protein n=1 Tax=Streptomyces sp. SID11385 TaxID=2706031 RepID=UPI0013CBB72F|nr:hypothetical protein [Streptomyces sp. SID11385]NEA38174.1 hypothetical protein [Streptomyces sp. SID11385]